MLKKLCTSNKQGGWILIDALVGLVIVVTALTALITMYSQATRATTANQTSTNAMYIAQRHLEELKQFDGLPGIAALPLGITDPADENVNGITYRIRIRLLNNVTDVLNNRMFPYQATVSWTDASVTPPIVRQIQIAAYYFSN